MLVEFQEVYYNDDGIAFQTVYVNPHQIKSVVGGTITINDSLWDMFMHRAPKVLEVTRIRYIKGTTPITVVGSLESVVRKLNGA